MPNRPWRTSFDSTMPKARHSQLDKDRRSVAQRLRMAREMAGLSQAQVADRLGLHRPSVSEIEAGRRRVSAEELSFLATLFGVSEAWILGSTPEKLEVNDDRISLAARELAKLSGKELEKLLTLLAALRKDYDEP